jgi:hypothetical protein
VLTGCCGEGTHARKTSAAHFGGPPTYRPPVAPEPINQIGSGSLHRLGERAIDDEVGSGAPAAGRSRDEHDATRRPFSGTPIRPVGFKAIVDLKASRALRSMLCQTPPWNKYFAARGMRRLEPSALPPAGGRIRAKIVATVFTGLPR